MLHLVCITAFCGLFLRAQLKDPQCFKLSELKKALYPSCSYMFRQFLFSCPIVAISSLPSFSDCGDTAKSSYHHPNHLTETSPPRVKAHSFNLPSDSESVISTLRSFSQYLVPGTEVVSHIFDALSVTPRLAGCKSCPRRVSVRLALDVGYQGP